MIRKRAPFRFREIHPDNDSGLINDLLWRYCRRRQIRLSRSRPYKKNDNAWVEQRNWSHVRKVVGYRRFDTAQELAALRGLYGALRLYRNFFQPTMKLASKERIVGDRSHNRADDPARIKIVFRLTADRRPWRWVSTKGSKPPQPDSRRAPFATTYDLPGRGDRTRLSHAGPASSILGLMILGHGYKAQYDYVELTVEQRAGHWRLTLRDNRHGEDILHEEEFATTAEAQDAALPLAQHHINIQHNDTLLMPGRLSWKEY